MVSLEALHECLDRLDALDAAAGIPSEDLEEWNAVFEDALFLMEVGDDQDAEDALEEIRELAANYRRFASASSELGEICRRLDALVSGGTGGCSDRPARR